MIRSIMYYLRHGLLQILHCGRSAICMSSAYSLALFSVITISACACVSVKSVSNDNNSQQLVKARPNNVLHSSSYNDYKILFFITKGIDWHVNVMCLRG